MICLDWRERVALLTVERPAKRNALTVELCEALRAAVVGALTDGTAERPCAEVPRHQLTKPFEVLRPGK
jgi:hypothetical protein